MSPHPFRWFDRMGAAIYLQCDIGTIDQLARQGRVKRYRIAGTGTPRFRSDELDACMVPAFDPIKETQD